MNDFIRNIKGRAEVVKKISEERGARLFTSSQPVRLTSIEYFTKPNSVWIFSGQFSASLLLGEPVSGTVLFGSNGSCIVFAKIRSESHHCIGQYYYEDGKITICPYSLNRIL